MICKEHKATIRSQLFTVEKFYINFINYLHIICQLLKPSRSHTAGGVLFLFSTPHFSAAKLFLPPGTFLSSWALSPISWRGLTKSPRWDKHLFSKSTALRNSTAQGEQQRKEQQILTRKWKYARLINLEKGLRSAFTQREKKPPWERYSPTDWKWRE